MTLIEMQRDMRAWLVREDAGAARRLGPSAGLRAYQNNYRSQLAACLEESFGRTRDWIGDDAFHQAVVAHVERVPPGSWTLDAYARDFPTTLTLRYPDDPEVGELASLELALAEAFVGPDAAALQIAQLAGVDWDRAVLRFTPTLDLAELTTNAPAIWCALAAGEVPPAAERLAEIGALLTWRHAQVSQFRAIDSLERQALIAARAAMPFAGLCAALVEACGEEQGVARAGEMLGQWLADGLIVDVVEQPGEGDQASSSTSQ